MKAWQGMVEEKNYANKRSEKIMQIKDYHAELKIFDHKRDTKHRTAY